MVTSRRVLVTGASSGIGLGFAQRFAEQGRPLVLVARDRPRLEALAADLRVDAEVLVADLGADDGLAKVEERLRAEDIDTLVNSAGFGTSGALHEIDVSQEMAMLDVNVKAVLRLTIAALPGMVERRRGDILNISSMAGFFPGSGAATYGAAKAYVTSLSQALASTYGDDGIRVVAVCPGFTHTDFHNRAGGSAPSAPPFMWLSVEQVVDTALRDLAAGKDVSIAGPAYKLLRTLTRVAPAPLVKRATATGRARRGRA